MESQNGHRPVIEPPSRVAAGPASTSTDATPSRRTSLLRAAHGALLVFVGGLGFFAFVIGSGLFGTAGQVVISLVFFGTALSWVWWVRLDEAQRERVVREVREYVSRKPSHS
jgi:hypothetical protein